MKPLELSVYDTPASLNCQTDCSLGCFYLFIFERYTNVHTLQKLDHTCKLFRSYIFIPSIKISADL